MASFVHQPEVRASNRFKTRSPLLLHTTRHGGLTSRLAHLTKFNIGGGGRAFYETRGDVDSEMYYAGNNAIL